MATHECDGEVLAPLTDPLSARWLVDRLVAGSPPPAVSSVVPLGYPAYVELSLRHDEDPSPTERVRDILLAHSHVEQDSYWAMWEGWPLMHTVPGSPSVTIPDCFDLFLFRHPLAGARDLLLTTHGDETLWWPQDRSWVYARPVDSDALYIACERPLAAALVNGGFAGAQEVRPTDPHMDDVEGRETH